MYVIESELNKCHDISELLKKVETTFTFKMPLVSILAKIFLVVSVS